MAVDDEWIVALPPPALHFLEIAAFVLLMSYKELFDAIYDFALNCFVRQRKLKNVLRR